MEILGKEAMKTIKRALMGVLALSGMFFAGAALAVGDSPGGPAVNAINLQPPATRIAEELYQLHTSMLILCTVIFIAVFAVMFYSIWKHRKSVGHKAANFHESVVVATQVYRSNLELSPPVCCHIWKKRCTGSPVMA